MAEENGNQISVILYKSFYDNMLDGLAYCQMVFDAQGQPVDWIYIQVNKNFEKLTGLKGATGKKVTELIPRIAISNPELFEIYGRVSLMGEPERFEAYVEPLSRWFLISVYCPQKSFFVAVFQNITEQKQKEEDLENAKIAARNVLEDLRVEKENLIEAKAKDEALLENIGDGVVATDKDGKVILVNKAAEGLLGFTSQEILGKLFVHVISMQDMEGNQIPDKLRPITLALGSGKSTTTTTTTTTYFVRKNGTKFPIAVIVTPVIIDSKTVGAVVVFHDITIEKELDRAKSEFISIASHQLRTPVSGLNWLTEALQFTSGNLDPKQKKYLGDLSSMTKRLVKLVEDLLDFSRIEFKTGVAAEKNQIEMSSFVEKFIKEMETYAVSKNHSIVLEKESFKPTEIEINTKALVNILQNLLSNAIEYSPSNTAVIVVLENIEGAVKVLIYNKGPVIPKEEQPHIFERFYRGESAKKMKAEGTGLGLYIVKNEIEDIGGKVGFESVEGKDTMFWFTLPLNKTDKKI